MTDNKETQCQIDKVCYRGIYAEIFFFFRIQVYIQSIKILTLERHKYCCDEMESASKEKIDGTPLRVGA